jgi:integrase
LKHNEQGKIAANTHEHYTENLNRYIRPSLGSFRLCELRPLDIQNVYNELCATVLLEAGTHPKVVADRLGHSSVMLTLDIYSHVTATLQQSASLKIANAIFGVSHTPVTQSRRGRDYENSKLF